MKGPTNPAASIFGGGGTPPWETFAEELRKAGHEVEVFESAIDKLLKLPEEERMARHLMGMYAGKAPISGLTSKYDLIVNVAQIVGGMQPVERVSWPASKGTPDLPWYVHEIPTMLISFSTPFVLADAPAVKCVINAYDAPSGHDRGDGRQDRPGRRGVQRRQPGRRVLRIPGYATVTG